jgi:hypothetical protein
MLVNVLVQLALLPIPKNEAQVAFAIGVGPTAIALTAPAAIAAPSAKARGSRSGAAMF